MRGSRMLLLAGLVVLLVGGRLVWALGTSRPAARPAVPSAASASAAAQTPPAASASTATASAAPSATPTASAAPSASPPAALPLTGFQRRGGASWTTPAEETRYLDRLARLSSRVRVIVVGTTRRGRPIRLVVAGPARSAAQIRAGRSALVVCSQHGDEPAAREACLQRVRTLASGGGDDTVLLIPTANPDGVAAGTRANSSGVDVNRTHRTLGTAESRAIASVLAEYRPDVLNDLHEYRTEGARRVLTRGDSSYGGLVSAAIRRLSVELTHRWQERAIQAGGYATAPYSDAVLLAGLVENAAEKHVVAGLTETPRRGRLDRRQRVDAQRRSIDGTLQMLRERGSALAAATVRAGRR